MPLSEKDNFMKVINGETPEWVPRYTFGPDKFSTKEMATASLMVNAIPSTFVPGAATWTDMFGVSYVASAQTSGAALPVPDAHIMEDVRDWHKILTLPDITNVDWDAVCKAAIDMIPGGVGSVATQFGGVGFGGGFFLPLMNMMGFTNGLIAMHEEPEAVHELYNYMADWYVYGIERTIDKLPVDIFTVGDDTAAAFQPFISPKQYHDLVVPYVSRLTKFAQDRNLPVMMHCCGRCEDFIEDWIDFGVTAWNPAQLTNDLDSIKKKYGNSLVLMGCWDSSGEAGYMYASEEVVRQAVRDCIDRFAPGGGFMFLGSVYGPEDDPAVDLKRKWMTEEYEAYRETPYK
ncbi:MAG: veratrol--corrinoid protein metyltransferase [Eubacteriaceae bacterium]|nr:veratrol--corrinoid protein metyltransferase [Eubacteriaceae bacterium]